MHPITRAAIALRYSSDKQHARSLDDQERNCRREIERFSTMSYTTPGAGP